MCYYYQYVLVHGTLNTTRCCDNKECSKVAFRSGSNEHQLWTCGDRVLCKQFIMADRHLKSSDFVEALEEGDTIAPMIQRTSSQTLYRASSHNGLAPRMVATSSSTSGIFNSGELLLDAPGRKGSNHHKPGAGVHRTPSLQRRFSETLQRRVSQLERALPSPIKTKRRIYIILAVLSLTTLAQIAVCCIYADISGPSC